MLMVTTTVRMLDGVHSDTSNSGPLAVLCLSLEVGSVGLKDGLVSPLATGTDADHASAGALHGLPHARGESDAGLLAIFGVADDDSRGAGGAGESSTVTLLGLDVGDDSAFGHGADGQDVADGKRSY